MSTQGAIQLGTIVWADLHDPVTGESLGDHPAIVLNSSEEIAAGADLLVAGCSTTFRFPLQSGWFAMPTGEEGRRLGLSEACVAKATWLDQIPQDEVRRIGPRAPARIYKSIKNWLADQERRMSS